jgi:hypothetical protein
VHVSASTTPSASFMHARFIVLPIVYARKKEACCRRSKNCEQSCAGCDHPNWVRQISSRISKIAKNGQERELGEGRPP